jgi:hypothetical protein
MIIQTMYHIALALDIDSIEKYRHTEQQVEEKLVNTIKHAAPIPIQCTLHQYPGLFNQRCCSLRNEQDLVSLALVKDLICIGRVF